MASPATNFGCSMRMFAPVISGRSIAPEWILTESSERHQKTMPLERPRKVQPPEEAEPKLIARGLGEMEGKLLMCPAEYHVHAGYFKLAGSVYDDAWDVISRQRLQFGVRYMSNTRSVSSRLLWN
mmetsp:Transcript_18072/g.36918  ORF Transcript_18072/g.36918 Transcript_18072/m.36918 type:complete len:125 (+) Transcript_18072:136-510(+)